MDRTEASYARLEKERHLMLDLKERGISLAFNTWQFLKTMERRWRWQKPLNGW